MNNTQERLEDKYTLKVWSDTYNRYVVYFTYSTLKRLKEQINKCIEDYQKPIYKRGGWYLWRGNKVVDFTTAKYIIEHKRYRITKEEVLSEVIKNENFRN